MMSNSSLIRDGLVSSLIGNKTFPSVTTSDFLRDAICSMNENRCGTCCVVDSRDILVGVFTDGDLRRYLSKDSSTIESLLMGDVIDICTTDFHTVLPNDSFSKCLDILQRYQCWDLPIVNESGQLLGQVGFHDLFIV